MEKFTVDEVHDRLEGFERHKTERFLQGSESFDALSVRSTHNRDVLSLSAASSSDLFEAGSVGARRSEKRIIAKKLKLEKRVPDPRTIDDILNQDTVNGKKNASPKRQASPDNRYRSEVSDLLKSKQATTALGSTQLHGCPGDFCHINLRNRESGMLDTASNDNKHEGVSEFRRKLLEMEDEEQNANKDFTSLIGIRNSGLNLRPALPQFTISCRTIIQSRKEFPLVKVLLKRFMRGEEPDLNETSVIQEIEEEETKSDNKNGFDYMSSLDNLDYSLGEEFAGRYYNDVNVCDVCWKIYSMIDKARATSTEKLCRERGGAADSVHSSRIECNNDDDGGDDSEETRAMSISLKALKSITKDDITELKSFVNPPVAVVVVVTALLYLLTGRRLTWEECKRFLVNGDRVIELMKTFDVFSVPLARIHNIDSEYCSDDLFCPDRLVSISTTSARICAWIIGAIQTWKYRNGIGHARIDVLSQQKCLTTLFAPRHGRRRGITSPEAKPQAKQAPSMTFAEKLDKRKKEKMVATPVDAASVTSQNTEQENREKQSRKLYQSRQVNRLAQDPSIAQTNASSGEYDVFQSSDGDCEIPYIVLGRMSSSIEKVNMVIINDLFDTMESMQIMLKPIVSCHDGCQILLFNYPGQANTKFPRSSNKQRTMNNEYYAEKLNELLQHVEVRGHMLLTSPFHLVGFGFGASIAVKFALDYGNNERYRSTLRSVVSVNGFMSVDAQLSAILHSCSNVFQHAPVQRPDAPISYFSRFIFSDDYLGKINPNLALNIYTAVTNTITLDGRVELCNSCLSSLDLSNEVKTLRVPLVIVQSTDNSFISPSNVEGFLNGKKVHHIWSHQINLLPVPQSSTKPFAEKHSLGQSGIGLFLSCMNDLDSALVIWVKSGHEVKQEQKKFLIDLFDALACPTEEYCGVILKNTSATIFLKAPRRIIEDGDDSGSPLRKISKPVRTETISLETPASQSSFNNLIAEPLKPEVISPIQLQPPAVIQSLEPSKISISQIPSTMRQSSADVSHPLIPKAKEIVSLKDQLVTPNIAVKEIRETLIVRFSDSIPEMPSKMETTSADSISLLSEANRLIIEANNLDSTTSTESQRKAKKWCELTTDNVEVSDLQAQLEIRHAEYLKQVDDSKSKQKEEYDRRLELLQTQQEERRKQYAKEDADMLLELENELLNKRQTREAQQRQLRFEQQSEEEALVKKGIISEIPRRTGDAIAEIAPARYEEPRALPPAVAERIEMAGRTDILAATLDKLTHIETEMKGSSLSVEEFEKVQFDMAQRQIERDNRLSMLDKEEEERLMNFSASEIERMARGKIDRKRCKSLRLDREIKRKKSKCILATQAIIRGFISRNKYHKMRDLEMQEYVLGQTVKCLQRYSRGYIARKLTNTMKRVMIANKIQRVWRGHEGRRVAELERKKLLHIRKATLSAVKIQASWRMRFAKEAFYSLRIHNLAALQLQKVFRGHVGRKLFKRRKDWETATPGPDRLKIGLKLIEESKVAFEKQQEEIDVLHRAQERAETKISQIHSELRESEKELAILEHEMLDVDQIERDLQQLTHDREVLRQGIQNAAGFNKTSTTTSSPMKGPKQSATENQTNMELLQAQSYALEMTIQTKRAERERRRQELEIEFASTYQDVEKKKKALKKLDDALGDMESTRQRKEREFQRLQRNLMQLLQEQKQELDSLREKGIELETATATTAAAAAATAQKAKEHEKHSAKMFQQTEELMKFQFMSMSLSYFSSLNMLKQLREMNSDTTSAAIASSAEAASAAAASSAASALPSVKQLKLGAEDLVELSIRKKQAELKVIQDTQDEIARTKKEPFPSDVRMWTVDDVCRWLQSLSLSQYEISFKDACVDGEFLIELREEDLVDVLGVKHKLHVRKILISRDKIKPLSAEELALKNAVQHEEKSAEIRSMAGMPDIDTVFSQARNGRMKRLEESLNIGFPIDAEDARGNTLLLVSAQNASKRMVEMLLSRGANINHQNAQGNTALHFAMTYDKEGQLGEYLIEKGANDSIANVEGLSCYDGIGSG